MTDNIKCCCKPPRPQPPKDHFPAMSAHFAHTLDDMSEQYLKAQYITIDTETGVFKCEILNNLLSSRSNMIVYQNRIFRFGNKEDDIYKYINIYNLDEDTNFKAQEVKVNGSTGYWQVVDLVSDDSQKIETLEEDVTNIQNNITEITQNITNITENITNLNTKLENTIADVENGFSAVDESLNTVKESLDKEISDRKEAIEQVITDTTSSFEAVKEELEVMDNEIQNEISDRISSDGDLQKQIDSNKTNIESNTRDIGTLEQGFETIDENLNIIKESVDTIKENVDKNAEDIKSLESGFETIDKSFEAIEEASERMNTDIQTEIEERKAADEEIITNSISAFKAVQEEFEIMDNKIDNIGDSLNMDGGEITDTGRM